MVNDPSQPDAFDPASSDALSPEDAAALDAIFDRESTAPPQRVEAVEGLLSLLAHRSAVNVDRSLVDATIARVARARRVGGAEAVLAEGDAAALDALVDAGFNASTLKPQHAERGRAAASLLSSLASTALSSTTAQRESLIAATLAKVERSEVDREAKYRIIPEIPIISTRLRTANLVGVAAAMLLGVSVVWPMLNEFREQGRRAACASNLAGVGGAFGMYAGDFSDSLPLASASRAGDSWLEVGTRPERSNAANLFTLVRTGYSGLEPLACSSSPSKCRTQEVVAPSKMDWRSPDDVSYSYQIFFGRTSQARMSASRGTVLLTDRSPIVVRALRNEPIDPFANSLNHGGVGQNILKAGGDVQWVTSPVLASGDHIYLPRSIEVLLNRSREQGQVEPIRGTETPEYQDVFVGP